MHRVCAQDYAGGCERASVAEADIVELRSGENDDGTWRGVACTRNHISSR